MEAIQRYELIRPILRGEKSVKDVHLETKVPMSTLYRYLSLFRTGGIESLRDKSQAPKSHPLWFTSEQKDKVIRYKMQHPERSARQIAKDLAADGILTISHRSVTTLLNQHGLGSDLSKAQEKHTSDSSQLEEVTCPQPEVIEPCEPISIRNERVDDIPLLLHVQQEMGICEVIDDILMPHGNRCGLSFGWLTTVWLSYILSEADHRMCNVESWAGEHLMTLQKLLPQDVCQKDFTDDRLADVLKEFSDDLAWEQIETLLGQRLVRVYNLHVEPVRLDSTSVSVYHEMDGTELFRLGHSKDHRPDLPQFKVMLATLDPLGLPLTTLILAGNEGDDGLYLPAIKQAKEIVGYVRFAQ